RRLLRAAGRSGGRVARGECSRLSRCRRRGKGRRVLSADRHRLKDSEQTLNESDFASSCLRICVYLRNLRIKLFSYFKSAFRVSFLPLRSTTTSTVVPAFWPPIAAM